MALTDWYCDEVLSGKLHVERVFEDERVLAFHHPRPSAQPHVVIIPKEHVPSLLDEKALDPDLLLSMIRAVQRAAISLGLDRDEGFYIRANAAAPGLQRNTCIGMYYPELAPTGRDSTRCRHNGVHTTSLAHDRSTARTFPSGHGEVGASRISE